MTSVNSEQAMFPLRLSADRQAPTGLKQEPLRSIVEMLWQDLK